MSTSSEETLEDAILQEPVPFEEKGTDGIYADEQEAVFKKTDGMPLEVYKLRMSTQNVGWISHPIFLNYRPSSASTWATIDISEYKELVTLIDVLSEGSTTGNWLNTSDGQKLMVEQFMFEVAAQRRKSILGCLHLFNLHEIHVVGVCALMTWLLRRMELGTTNIRLTESLIIIASIVRAMKAQEVFSRWALDSKRVMEWYMLHTFGHCKATLTETTDGLDLNSIAPSERLNVVGQENEVGDIIERFRDVYPRMVALDPQLPLYGFTDDFLEVETIALKCLSMDPE